MDVDVDVVDAFAVAGVAVVEPGHAEIPVQPAQLAKPESELSRDVPERLDDVVEGEVVSVDASVVEECL